LRNGKPVPKLLIQNCWFENSWNRNQQDSRGKKVQYIKTDFEIRDDSIRSSFPGIWWGHYKEELPMGRCDCIAELDYNTFKKRYEIRLIAVRRSENSIFQHAVNSSALIVDWRNVPTKEDSALLVKECPTSWDDLRVWLRRSLYNQQQLAIAWSKPENKQPEQIWLTLVGIAKYLSRTNQTVTRVQLLEKLGIKDQTLYFGFRALKCLGFTITRVDRNLQMSLHSTNIAETVADAAVEQFLATVREEQFQRQYFAEFLYLQLWRSLKINRMVVGDRKRYAKHIKALHAKGKRLLTPEQRVKVLAERLKSLGVDPDSLV
jgi:single-stranded-DNA-specific exonuclease